MISRLHFRALRLANLEGIHCRSSLRRDIGATAVTIAGTGFLSMAEDNDLPQLGYAGWRDDKWESWSSDEMAGFLRNQSMHFVHGATARLEGRNATCCSGTPVECQPLECYGSCFVHSLPQSQLDYYSTLIDKVRSAGTGALTLMYHESYVSAAAPFASSSDASKSRCCTDRYGRHGEPIRLQAAGR